MFKLIRYLKGYFIPSAVAPVFKFMEALFELIIPLVVARIIDIGIAGGDTGYVYRMGGLMIGLGVTGFLCSTVCQYLAARSSLGYGTNLRRALYRHINTFSFAELDRFGPASLVTRLSNDINQTQAVVAMFIRLVMRAPFITIGSIVMAMMIDVKLSLIFLGGGVVIAVVLFVIMRGSVPFYKRAQKGLDRITRLTQENLSGARVVKAFAKEGEEEADFNEAADDLARINIRVGRIAGLLNPLTYAVINLSVALIIWLGGKTVYYGDLTQGEIIALVNYLNQILLALVVIANLVVTFTKASASAARINEVFAVSSTLREGEGAVPVPGAPALVFDNVSFKYGADVGYSLENISFTLNAGETLGIIGGTGSGKSTLVNLIPRYYDAEGEIRIDGAPIQDYTAAQLQDKIAVVAQTAHLFSGTIADNLRFAKPDADEDEMREALSVAQADFVFESGEGLDRIVQAKGRNFSGGQKQRLSVARAVIKKPEILVLDDAASALDFATEARLRAAISRMPCAKVIVSQRIGSIKGADKILVLDEGRAVGFGTHETLLTDCPPYAELNALQSGGEPCARP